MKILTRFVIGVYGWLWMTKLLRFGATAEEFHIYLSNTASAICDPDMTVLLYAKSRIACAVSCLSMQCSIYEFQGGVCSVARNPNPSTPSTGIVSQQFWKLFTKPDLVDIARGKNTQSVTHWPNPQPNVGDKGVDGDEGATSYFHSHPDILYPWWVVDLGENNLVKEVHVLPDGSGTHTNFFQGVEVRVGKEQAVDGNFSSWPLLDAYEGPPSSTGHYVEFVVQSSLCGRFVSIKRTTAVPEKYLVFNEVKVLVNEEDI